MQTTDKKLSELLKQWGELEYNKRLLSLRIFGAESKRTIGNNIDIAERYIKTSAKEYGKHIDEIRDARSTKFEEEHKILEEYEASMQKIAKIFEERFERVNRYKAKLQDKKFELYQVRDYANYVRGNMSNRAEDLRKRNMEALERGDFDEAEKIIEELKDVMEKKKSHDVQIQKIAESIEQLDRMIGECDSHLANLTQEREKAFNELQLQKTDKRAEANSKFMIIAKQKSWIQRTVESVMNRVNGNKKFRDNVLDRLQSRIDDINNKSIPQISEETEDTTIALGNHVEENSIRIKPNSIKNAIGEIGENISAVGEKGRRTIKNVISTPLINGYRAIGNGIKYLGDGVSNYTLGKYNSVNKFVTETKESFKDKLEARNVELQDEIEKKKKEYSER